MSARTKTLMPTHPVLPALTVLLCVLQAVLFKPDAFKVVSRHHNMIAFAVDMGLLSKALHSAVNNDADEIDMKLTQKAVLVPGSEDGETENRPFLCITSRVRRDTLVQRQWQTLLGGDVSQQACAGSCSILSVKCDLNCLGCNCVCAAVQGSALNLVQDLPISKPLTASEINTLSDMVGAPNLCSFYHDLKGVQPRLAAALDRMKALSSVVHFALCKVGHHAALTGLHSFSL